ncbi:amino acid ABC transporter permease [Helicobacter bilis]|uniref:Amino acid ABC transporter permease n=2 Tax=Helicobacter bilis TaxID=37372 RepID=A0A4U8U9R5_9HELI|nr:amino acid ABC transporter permease [Helicobacter bilis]MCI7411520.1 amino acid ABC transporter permease [Helicobacter bilis]MDD7297368.1 amino acid ABC transporter permease [Helicobacter bilis]MDY4400056.1 amino acid ABC transporter permease [Helicobacter bilis]TLE08323.1 amino acid ABC transporter permease [Helicobacter bilis]TLE11013.1 amino acid ABC transporter permease [Helicobacter bilis]
MGELFSLTTLWRVLDGVGVLLFVALISIIFSVVGGLIMGRLMIVKSKIMQYICRFFLESVRIVPLIAWLFIIYYGIPSSFDLHISAISCGIIVFSMWGIAEMGDLVRASILNIPKHQRESALALGFSTWQIEYYIIIPQALKALMPSSINLFGRIIKTTSLLPLIGVVELLKVGQQLIEVVGRHDTSVNFIVYGAILLIYFMLCYPFSYIGNYLEKKFITQ